MSLVPLTDKHFYLAGRHNKTLNLTLNGNFLVLFKMLNCPNCTQFEPIFYQLSQKDKRIHYAICDLSQFPGVTQLSQRTNYPIKAVPWIFFYSGGFPVARFKGNRNIPSIQAFVGKALQEVQNRQQRGQRSFVSPQGAPPQGAYPNQTPSKYWKPDMDKTPSLRGALKGNEQYSYMGEGVEEEDDKIRIPEDITPHNMPWKAGYKKLGI